MIAEIIHKYLEAFPEDRPRLGSMLGQIAASEVMNDRKNFNGHITGGAFILNPERTKLLVIYHKLFDKWLQPGGHWDPGEVGPWAAAAREAHEETGVVIKHSLNMFDDDTRIPLYIETHAIKNRPQKKEPAHDHHDFKYAFVAETETVNKPRSEVNISDMAWMPLDDPRLNHMSSAIARLEQWTVTPYELGL
jgi:8-oxo-dGTP pyrophosphatase MutT (NUDIX family)